jgi:hypothetical protein
MPNHHQLKASFNSNGESWFYFLEHLATNYRSKINPDSRSTFLAEVPSFKEKRNRGTSGDRAFLVNVQQIKGLPIFEGHLNHQSKEYD